MRVGKQEQEREMLSDSINQMIKKGKIYDLGKEFFMGMPRYPTHPPFMFSLIRTHKKPSSSEDTSSAACMFTVGGHTGTHIDALGHKSKGGRVYGHGEEIYERQSCPFGLEVGGIEETPPILRRGVLLDVPRLKGCDVLPSQFSISDTDLELAVSKQKVEVREGDVLLVRTGWVKYWGEGEKFGGPPGAPGIGDSACHWMVSKKVAYTGTDTTAFSQVKNGKPVGRTHAILMAENGIQIMETLFLEDLAKDEAYEFLFIALPLKIKGGTASPIRPIAVVY